MDGVRAYRLSRELAEKEPRSGVAQFAFGFTTVFVLFRLPEQERPEALAAARSAAVRARTLLPGDGDAYALDCMLKPPGSWVLTAECDKRFRQALAFDPDAYFVPAIYADLLVESGSYHFAERVSARAVAVAPLDMGRMALRLQVLSMLDRIVRAHYDVQGSEGRQVARYAPAGSNGHADYLAYQTLLWAGDLEKAEAMLHDRRSAPNLESDPNGPAHLMFKALRSRNASDIQASRTACDPPSPSWLPADPAFGTCLAGFQALNDLDTVFRLASHGYQDVACCSAADAERKFLAGGGPQYPRDYLLGPAAAKMRADRRYIDLARRTGLLAYWKSGHAPDFCWSEQAPVCELLK
jgi:hypothetical protein